MNVANRICDIVGRWTVKANGCWEWNGHPCTNGYGQFSISGVLHMAHRISWIFHNGDIMDDNVKVLHSCDNKLCVNPEHLFLGSQQDNADDMRAKNRAPNQAGANNGNAKLNEIKVAAIRIALNNGRSRSELAKEYSVSWNTIDQIKSNKIWRHVQ